MLQVHRLPRLILLALLLAEPATVAEAHAPRLRAIVDTDVAVDDVRALALLIQSPDVEVLAVITSDGGSSPAEGAARIARVLEEMDRADLPIGIGRTLGRPAPAWRGVAAVLDTIGDGGPAVRDGFPEALPVARSALGAAGEPVVWIALGPLTSLADLLREEPALRARISMVYFSGTAPDDPEPGWNALRDPESASRVLASGLPVRIVPHRNVAEWLPLDDALFAAMEASGSRAGRLISGLHGRPEISALLGEGHLQAWDDLAALAVAAPDLFRPVPRRGGGDVQRMEVIDPPALRAALRRILGAGGGLAPRRPVALARFPSLPEEFRTDLRPHVEAILERHGPAEWEAALLTNELHRHLGIYSLVGVKMGIRARELLGASLDDLRVESRAGLDPPLSCLTDGLQAATGATLGRGSIRVAAGDPAPEALFTHGDRRLRLSLDAAVQRRIREDVRSALRRFGANTPEYFDEIRRLSILCWLELDRHEIFEERFEEREAGERHDPSEQREGERQ